MPSIVINEIDNTKGGGVAQSTDIVYIPGFMSISADDWGIDNTGTNAALSRTPVLCTTITEFERYFGPQPHKFTADVKYSDLGIYADGCPAVPKGEDPVFVKANTYDKSYIYAKELLNLGIPVLYESINSYNPEGTVEAPDIKKMYTAMQGDLFTVIQEKGEFDIKYITSGGYPTFETGIGEPSTTTNDIATKMITAAYNRGDCVALIDHTDNPDRDLTGVNSFYDAIKVFAKAKSTMSDFAAAFTPWVTIDCVTLSGKKNTNSMPPSFAYLAALAKSIKTNANWIAIAGATRGQIPNLSSANSLNITKRLTNSIAENEYQNRDGISINAITNIKPFGYRIWGNRTLKDNSIEQNLTATSFLNIRNMVSDIKKVAYMACKKYMFEQNNDVLWTNFKSYIEPTLDKMQTGAGLSGYKIIKQPTTEKAKLIAIIKLYPLYAVEDFEITVTMEDDEIAVS